MTRARLRLFVPILVAQILAGRALCQCPTLTLTPGIAQSTLCSPTAFNLVPMPNRWNAVGVKSFIDWNLTLLPAISALSPAFQDFVVSNGHLGAPLFTSGAINVVGPPIAATLQQAAVVTLAINQPLTETLPAGDQLRLYEFEVLTAGTYTVTVSCPAALGWGLYTPGSNTNWRPRNTSAAQGAAGTAATLALGAGWHCLSVARDLGTGAGAATLTASVTCGATPIVPFPDAFFAVTHPCQFASVPPVQSHWNVIGVTSSSQWNVGVGNVVSDSSGAVCNVVCANGALGPIPNDVALFSRLAGSSGAYAVQAIGTLFSQSLTANWGQAVLRVYEFDVAQAAFHDVTITGHPALRWQIQRPGTGPAWCDGSNSIQGTINGTVNALLHPGRHALILTQDGGLNANGPVTVAVQIAPNPTPGITGHLPTHLVAGDPDSTIFVQGQGFVPSTVVIWGGQSLATTFVNDQLVSGFVPAALLAQPSRVPVGVMSPAPGGGNSPTFPFDVDGIWIHTVAPSGIAAPLLPTSPPVAATLSGKYFTPTCQVWADGVLVASQYQSAGAMDITLPPTIPGMTAPGGVALTVVDGPLVSNAGAFTIGAALNAGTITLLPPAPFPGQPFLVRASCGVAGGTLAIVASAPPPSPWMYNGVLVGIDLATLFPVVDGLGAFGPGDGTVLILDQPPAAGGVFTLGAMMPGPPLGIQIAIQAAYPSGGTGLGINLTLPRVATF